MINETAQPENYAPTQQVAPNNELLVCDYCNGDGVDPNPEPICCQQPVVGAEYMGQVDVVCCGSPEPDYKQCEKCQGTGRLKAH